MIEPYHIVPYRTVLAWKRGLTSLSLAWQVKLSDLSTLGPVDFDGKLKSRFTAHPKVDATTGKPNL